MPRSVRIVYVVGLATLFGVFAAEILLAQGGLQHFSPHEVEKLPTVLVTRGPIADEPRLMNLADLERTAGFSLLIPMYLPPDCKLRERFYIPLGKEAFLAYSCMEIAQKKAESTDHALIGKDSSQELMIGREPGIYVDGGWVRMPGQKEPTWVAGFDRMLVFEHKKLVIRLSSLLLTKDELIRIAESME